MLSKKNTIFNRLSKVQKKFLYVFFTCTALLPHMLHAQVVNNIKGIGALFTSILQSVVMILIGAAIVVFLWSIFKYLTEGKNEAKREEAKQYMIYGVIAIFIMVSVWGLVELLSQTVNIQPFLGLPGKK
jgi:hypothetical protein